MRSKLGTKSRLAAHILALVLLILTLVYLAPDNDRSRRSGPEAVLAGPKRPTATITTGASIPAPAKTPQPLPRDETPLAKHAPPKHADTLDKIHTPAVATRFPETALRPPGSDAVAAPAAPAPGITSSPLPHPGTLSEPAASVAPSGQPLRPQPPAAAEAEKPEEAEEPEKTAEPEESVSPVHEEEPEPETAAASDEPEESAILPDEHPEETPGQEETPEQTDPEPHTGEPTQTAPHDAQTEELAPFTHDEAGVDAIEAETAPEETATPPAAPEEDHPGPVTDDDNADSGDISQNLTQDEEVPHLTAQPDESGSLVVAASGAGLSDPEAATTPLPNAALEVLGDGVYWLDPIHDLEKELAGVPDIGSLVLLTPLPDYHVHGFEHVRTEAIPADVSDLTSDSAERFLHETSESKRPVVVAALPGARGAAFFKGAYLLANRNLTTSEVLREIEHDLEHSGEAREEIVHRLLRMPRPDRETPPPPVQEQTPENPEDPHEEIPAEEIPDEKAPEETAG